MQRTGSQHDDAPIPPAAVPLLPDPNLRGNVTFADGRAEYVPRSYAHDPAHYVPTG